MSGLFPFWGRGWGRGYEGVSASCLVYVHSGGVVGGDIRGVVMQELARSAGFMSILGAWFGAWLCRSYRELLSLCPF